MASIAEALAGARQRLEAGSDSPRLDAEVLLAEVLACTRTTLYTWPERALTDEQTERFEALLERRAGGTPIAHLLGRREFWSLPLAVSSATLIPRPETELLVEQALARVPADAAWRIADLGTGSGAIALAVASERPRCQVLAVERSTAALAVAESNRMELALTNVVLRQGSWFEPLAGECFDLILSNPPYIPAADPHLAEGDVRFEPREALAAGADGLDDLRHLIAGARSHLRPGGWLLLEHGYDQGPAVTALLRNYGYTEVQDRKDAAGNDRLATARWPGEARPSAL